ncbi:MAG: hypothetical protein KF760_34675 [Candidatus Eremiobacteraeota bacterium]|nr:hypothetical protein [Candidatus Eremiobacteraeota bacterium]MCW5868410.1 hypothetical protein [Candidatus Eremiobacteraeota bacterium]
MKNSLCKAIGLALAAVLAQGCGSDTFTLEAGPANNGPTSDLTSTLEQAMVANPDLALRFAPTALLNPRRATPSATLLSVSDLEADYETVFGSLSDTMGVTLQTPQVQSNIQFIASQPGTGYFNLLNQPILNNPVGVTQVAFQSLEYDTTVPLPNGNQTFHVSGGLLLPQGIGKAQLKGVVVYFHGTTFSKAQVPSNYGSNIETQLMAEVFASQGYAVVMPDYVGQGVDWLDVHPYVVYPKASAKTAVDMLAAVKQTLLTSYGILPTDPALKLFSVGYSEGGAYSLWFNQFLCSNPGLLDSRYQLTHSVGIEGAYDLSNVTFNYLFDNVRVAIGNTYQAQTQTLVNIVKPAISADVFLSYACYSLAGDYNRVFFQDFFDMVATDPVPQAVCNFGLSQLTIAQAFAQQNVSCATQIVFSALGKSNNGATYPKPAALLLSSNNSCNALVSSNLTEPGFLGALDTVLRAADVDLSAVADQGVSIVSLDQDSVVTPNNFDSLLAKFPGKIRHSYKVDHTKLQVASPFSPPTGPAVFVPTDHLHALIFEFLYALNTFNSFP